MPLVMCTAPHPAVMPGDDLLELCELRTQRRSGPGGQHRNKTSSGVFLVHRPTGIVGEATERRSQAENRYVALLRLRLRLATEVRTPSILEAARDQESSLAGEAAWHGDRPAEKFESMESELRHRYGGVGLRIGVRNPAWPAVLALVLNDLHAGGGQPSLVAPCWSTTTSAVVRFVKTHAPAFALLNAIRNHHSRRSLK